MIPRTRAYIHCIRRNKFPLPLFQDETSCKDFPINMSLCCLNKTDVSVGNIFVWFYFCTKVRLDAGAKANLAFQGKPNSHPGNEFTLPAQAEVAVCTLSTNLYPTKVV